jgi:lauroyl/myristoyl acyltransferase
VITYGNKLHQNGITFFNDKGLKLQTLDEQFDDSLVRYAKHAKMIEKKLKDARLMRRLNQEAEEWVKNNPEEPS